MITEVDLPDKSRALRIANADAELIVACSFGPRILRYSLIDGVNLLGQADDASIESPLGSWRARGGHRLWHAPEVPPRSYVPDNDPVDWRVFGDFRLRAEQLELPTAIVKSMDVALDPSGSRVEITHGLRNAGLWEIELAPWALTIMKEGGEVVLPNEPFQSHTENVLPVRSLVFWSYTDPADPRLSHGSDGLRVRCIEDQTGPLKIGMSNSVGWAAYDVDGLRFVKSFGYAAGANYPDRGCNCEVYTAGGFLELETLGPLARLASGDTVEHVEVWRIEADDHRAQK